jgi:aminoglycoside phosphotransferase (APT) family kinase protein
LNTALPNPEAQWERNRGSGVDVERAVRERLGEVAEPFRQLGGGLANDSIRVGDRVLRIYRRDVESLAREAALLERSWQHVRVPQVVERGDDFLLLEFVEHTPLSSAPEQAAAVGRALAEIHRDRFEDAGFLAAQARRVARPFGDFVDAFCAHVESLESVPADISAAIVARFEAKRAVLAGLADRPVLLHGDFKVSNIHWTEEGRPLVLDWEFAYAGPSLLDVGQILRWEVPDAWVEAFAGAYRHAGGALPDGWRGLAETLDLVNLAGLLDGAAHSSRRREDVLGRLRQSL